MGQKFPKYCLRSTPGVDFHVRECVQKQPLWQIFKILSKVALGTLDNLRNQAQPQRSPYKWCKCLIGEVEIWMSPAQITKTTQFWEPHKNKVYGLSKVLNFTLKWSNQLQITGVPSPRTHLCINLNLVGSPE